MNIQVLRAYTRHVGGPYVGMVQQGTVLFAIRGDRACPRGEHVKGWLVKLRGPQTSSM